MALVTTPGASNANSYADVTYVDAYAVGHPLASGWTAADTPTKEGKLVRTTRLIDASPGAWTGGAVTSTQALGWPRSGMLNRNGFAIATNVIPVELKDAHAEFALQMVAADTRTADNAIVDQGINKVKVGPIEVGFAGVNLDNTLLTAREVRAKEAALAVLPDAVKYLLVPSWLKPDPDEETSRAIVFEVL